MSENKPKKILFAAGGTGGHVFPAIAAADAVHKVDPGAEIAFVGSSHGHEKEWVEKAGYRFILLEVDFIKGASLGRKLKNVCQLPGCARRAKAILKSEKPDFVIGSGGYVSGPLVFVASRLHIPTAIMEQNAIPGLTNRILSHFVNQIFTSFPHTEKLPAEKVVLTGNPVRAKAIPESDSGDARQDTRSNILGALAGDHALHLLIFGGSQGALSLNRDMPKALSRLSEDEKSRIVVRHQAGRNKLDVAQKAYADAGLTAETTEFMDDMGEAYRWADLLVCRAGATSLAEIKAAHKAAILVPFPYAAHQHQEKNADAMVAMDAAWKVLDADIEQEIPKIIAACLAHPEEIQRRADHAFADAKPDAGETIAKIILGMASSSPV